MTPKYYVRDVVLISLSFFIAMLLDIVPLPHWAIWARPQWVFLVLMFWILVAPHRVGIGIAWLAGLFIDLLLGTLLGVHACVMSVVAYLVIKFHPHMRTFHLLQQSVMIFVLCMLNLALQYWLSSLAGSEPDTWLYWLPALTSAIMWPWVYVLLNEYQFRFSIQTTSFH